MNTPKTLFDKIWGEHVISQTNKNQYLKDSEHLFLSSANLSDALVTDLNLLIKNKKIN